MGWWKKMIGNEPIESHIIGNYTKRKENNLDFYGDIELSEDSKNKYLSKRNIKSQIIAHKYSTDAYRIEFKSEMKYVFSFFGNVPSYHPRSYLFDVVAPLEQVRDLVRFQLSDLKNRKSGIILLANSNFAILSLSKDDGVEYYK